MSTTHVGRWTIVRIVYDQGGGSRWKPQGLAFFGDDGQYRYADKYIDESGTWLSDGSTVTTEDPSMGTTSTWRHRPERDQLERELSDEDTGYRGSALLVFERADDDAFRAGARARLRTLPGLGAADADALMDAGVYFVSEMKTWTAEKIERLAGQTGLEVGKLERWRKAARGW
jgi:hypothetical protein